ncbi:TRAP transporter substrate-binding protein [bacterium]|jgi:C4-dicarboxylate-binding protein DctP|nr:TRAP transporter substrate-binding protein [bacterium]
MDVMAYNGPLMKTLSLSFAGYQGTQSIHTKAAIVFGEGVKARHPGPVNFELEPDVLSKGYKSGDLLGLVERNEFNMCYISSIRFSGVVPALKIFELPFLIQDRQKIYDALDGALGDHLKTLMEAATPYRVLGFWDNGFRHLTNSVRPIRMPEDCQGLRLRIQMSDFLIKAFKPFGFDPVTMDIKDFIDQLGSNDADAVNAHENPLTNIANFKIHEHQKYITLTGHILGVAMMLCNKDVYHAWPADVRAAVDAAAAEASHAQREFAMAEDEVALSTFDPARVDVVQLSADERKAFEAAAAPLVEAHRDEIGAELFDYLR